MGTDTLQCRRILRHPAAFQCDRAVQRGLCLLLRRICPDPHRQHDWCCLPGWTLLPRREFSFNCVLPWKFFRAGRSSMLTLHGRIAVR